MKRAKRYCTNRAFLVAHQMWLQWLLVEGTWFHHVHTVWLHAIISILMTISLWVNQGKMVLDFVQSLLFYGNSWFDPVLIATYFVQKRTQQELMKVLGVFLTIYYLLQFDWIFQFFFSHERITFCPWYSLFTKNFRRNLMEFNSR